MKTSKFAPMFMIAAAACTLAGAGAYGQAMEVVTVEAVREIIVGKSPIGAPIKELSIRSRVSYADLDLTTDAGVEALYRRLKVAARQVCSVYEDYMLERAIKHRGCYNQALTEAVTKVNVETLSALHRKAAAPPRVS